MTLPDGLVAVAATRDATASTDLRGRREGSVLGLLCGWVPLSMCVWVCVSAPFAKWTCVNEWG